jgi:hypothetical protein
MARALAVVIASLTVLSGLAALAAPTVATGADAVHPAYLQLNAVNGYGDTTRSFSPGPGAGDIYVDSYDSNGDATGVVTIHDQNYTRDGLPNPVANWTVTFHGDLNDTYPAGPYYALPLDLNYSGRWTINLTAGGVSIGIVINVRVYSVGVSSQTDMVLPGHNSTLFYSVVRDADDGGSPFTNFESLQLVGQYYTTGGLWEPLPGLQHDLPIAGLGNVTFGIPRNVLAGRSALEFSLWANQTGAPTNWSEEGGLTVEVGNITGVELSFIDCPTTCDQVDPGAPVVVQAYVEETDYYGSEGGAGLTCTFSFKNNGVPVTPPAGTPTTVTSNASGFATIIFDADTSVFSTSLPNSVQVNVSDANNPGIDVGVQDLFFINERPQSARLSLLLGADGYHAGDTVTGNWSLGGANGSAVASGWSGGFWEGLFYNLDGDATVLAEGYAAAGSTSGTVSFLVPLGDEGTVDLYVEAYNATQTIYAEQSADVSAPTILLTPNTLTYAAGETITVSVTTLGQALSGATLYEETDDDAGNLLSTGLVTGGSFQVTVPSVAPPEEIAFHVAAQTTTAGVLATATTYAYLESGFFLSVSVQSSSSYEDGSFKPGQTVTLAYDLEPIGQTKAPSAVELFVVPGGYAALQYSNNYPPGAKLLELSASSGTISYTIPSNEPNGIDDFFVGATALGGVCGGSNYNCTAGTDFSVNVNANPAALEYEVAGSIGLTLGWLVLLILLILVAIVGLLWARRRRGGRSGGSTPPRPFEATTPSAASEPTSSPPSGASSPPTPPGGPSS